MKKFSIMVIALAMLITGFAMADPGMNQTTETQRFSTSTSIDVYGNVASKTDLTWEIASLDDVRSIDLNESCDRAYIVTYTEDTMSNGDGAILYDKEFGAETAEQRNGLWNIEATKQIQFAGTNGARIYSEDSNMMDAAGYGCNGADAPVLCPFFPESGTDVGAFCNVVKTGSSIDMTFANVRTTSEDRFIIPVTDDLVEHNYDISVTDFTFPDGSSSPSVGSASAYMDVLVRESRNVGGGMNEQIKFSEKTDVNGEITLFQKMMHYESGFAR